MQTRTVLRALAVQLLMLTPAWAGTITLNGNVTYRERITLPPDAWLRVTLIELDNAAPIIGASASIPARGQVPLAFSLNVRNTLEADTAYGLVAEISSAGAVLFYNPVPVPVAPRSGHVPDIVVNFVPPPPDPKPGPLPDPPPEAPIFQADLVDIVWTVTSIGGRPVSGDRPLTLSIAPDHRAGGFGGCNNYFTETSIEGSTITFGPAAATRMACDAVTMGQEAGYFAALAAVASYERDEHGLRLRDAAGVPLIGLIGTE
ncbi:META domain-containing protein [Devosia sp. CAU 1758]